MEKKEKNMRGKKLQAANSNLLYQSIRVKTDTGLQANFLLKKCVLFFQRNKKFLRVFYFLKLSYSILFFHF
jgi:hypothetical protein